MGQSRVLVVGGTGRTGAHLVRRLQEDPTLDVCLLARDPAKVARVFGPDASARVVHGDLSDLSAWAHVLDGVDFVVTAVSCGVRTDLLVLLGLRPEPANLPYAIDYQGIARLAEAAKSHGVRRFVAVTSASTGTPWSLAGVFLNTVCRMSIKWKFFGEQAIRESGIDYVIIRPFGLTDAPHGPGTGLGISHSQGRTEGASRRIPREDVAALCHEALRAPARNVTFECWKSGEHKEAFPWGRLRAEPPNSVPDVNHDMAVAAAGFVLAGSAVCATTGAAYAARSLLRYLRR